MRTMSFQDDVFAAFVWYGLLVIVKMMLMSIYISTSRVWTRTFANEEDAASFGGAHTTKGKPMLVTNPMIERARRAHLNDLENIIPFFLVGFVYASSNPDLDTALLHFRIFFSVRVAHSITYLFKLPQPSRFVFFLSGYVATLSMAVRVLVEIGW